MGKDLMKQKANKKLKSQAAAIIIGLIVSALGLTALFILSEMYISELDGKISMQLDTAFEAIERKDFAAANECGKAIRKLLEESEANLKLFVNHRDITELMKYADDAARIGVYGEEDAYAAYITDFTGIRCLLDFLRDNNRFSLAGVL